MLRSLLCTLTALALSVGISGCKTDDEDNGENGDNGTQKENGGENDAAKGDGDDDSASTAPD